MDDILLRGLQFLSAFPAAFLLSLCSLVLYAGSRLGLWPVAHLNDPKDIGLSYGLFHLLICGLFLGFLLVPLGMSQRGSGTRPARLTISWSAITLTLWVLFIVVVKCDPGSFVEWLFD